MPQPDPQPDPEAVAAAVFAALAEPTRRSILGALAARGPMTATSLAGLLPISRQAITRHLELLAAAGLVLAEPGERRRIRFRVNAAPMAMAQSYLAAMARDWDSKAGPAATGRPGSPVAGHGYGLAPEQTRLTE
jgi:DNA-binding transcriptional ArsR family regulator